MTQAASEVPKPQAGAPVPVLVSPDDLALLEAWNDTVVDWGEPGNASLGELVARAVARDGVALIANGQAWSYREFDALVGLVASVLRGLGAGHGSMVGVLCERGIGMIAGLHAAVRIGGVFVPLDPSYPADRLRFMIEESGIEVVVAAEDFLELVPAEISTVNLDLVQVEFERNGRIEGLVPEGLASRWDGAVQLEMKGDDPVYVFYTSGSTGRPKGVMNTHRGVVNQLLWMQDKFNIGPDNKVLLKTPFTFDVSVWEFFWPLMTGAQLVVAEPGGHRDPTYLVETINRHQIDTVQFVPSMLRLFLDHPTAASCTSLRRVISIGEALTNDLVERFFEVLPQVELHNLYGPTEAAIAVTWWECQPGHDSPVVPIGGPIANTTLHVLDDNLQQCPIGLEGELFIGGVQVAVGYVNRDDLTVERFLNHPDHGRVYRTGDLARWSIDGTVEFLGRLDYQVKIRGQRIELGEIEATLGEHLAVLEAAVTVTNAATEPQLVAHVMPRDTPPSTEMLKAFLAEKLPAPMIPDFYLFHQELPLTSNGKVDRNALTAMELPKPKVHSNASNGNELERYLSGIWAELLGLPAVGLHDRVFDLGATSLKAAGFVNQVQRDLEEIIFVATVFTSPTVAEYAAFLSREYPKAVSRKFGLATTAAANVVRGPITARSLEEFEGVIPRFGPFPSWEKGPLNPSMAFILSPPRSGTTLLRVMLAGHPQLFAATELQLLAFDTLQERRRTYEGRYSGWLEGTVRALMELEQCDAVTALQLMEEEERRGLSSKEFYRYLQDRTGGRVLIDKTPTDALDLDVLRNAERGFDRPRYIHLLRDPASMSRSFENYHMDQILYLGEHGFSPRQLGELVWTVSHRNITAFAGEVDSDRFLRVSFEDLVTEPEPTMRAIADFLGVDYHPNLIDPYNDLGSKMVDGLHPESTPMGDTRLLDRRHIDATVVDRWTAVDTGLGEPTLRMAAQLGYGIDRAGTRQRFAEQSRRRRLARTGGGDE